MNLTAEQIKLLQERKEIKDRFKCSSCNGPVYQSLAGALSADKLHIMGKATCVTPGCPLKNEAKWFEVDSNNLIDRFIFQDWYKEMFPPKKQTNSQFLKELAKIANRLADLQTQLEELVPEQKALELEYTRLVNLINIKEVEGDDILL